ncbi:MAG: hypothetical protein A3H28_07590 [Acidobacteria bacterium RIFCSPLOWO2_02_FULL_61_28]|nr:MAG: hypothetical protein A3H28_07590 [Acidobacteria bacterium RIFCSPLOWO2_02_FULL_61_28]
MLEQALAADPNLARRVLRPLAGTVFPIQGGVPTCTAGTIPKFDTSTCGDPLTNSVMVESSSGNVGIGMTPGYKLDVAGGDVNIAAGQWYRAGTRAVAGYSASPAKVVLGTANAVDLSLYAGAVDRLFIKNSNGNVGIGTPNPGAKLDVSEIYRVDTASIALTADGTYQIASSPEINGIYHLYWTGPNRVHKMVVAVQSRQFDDANVVILSSHAYGNQEVFSDPRVVGSADGSTRYFVVTVGNRNGGTGNADVAATGQTPALAVSAAPGGSTAIVNNRNILCDPSGNVGIGTTTPATKLHVEGAAPALTLLDTNASGKAYRLRNGSLAAGTFDIFDNTGSASRLAIKSDGKVGIGETNPQANLHIQAGGEGLYIESALREGRLGFVQNGETSARTVFYRGGPDAVPDITILRNFAATGPSSEYTLLKIWAPPGASVNNREATLALVRGDNDEEFLDLYNNGYSTETQYGIRMVRKDDTIPLRDFVIDQKRADTGAKTPLMFIKADGKVGIGTQTPGNILTVVQNSATDPIADAWTTYSSRRWKTNIHALEGALEKVERLRGVSYERKADGKPEIGVIGEEVGEVVPEIVTFEQNGKDAKSVDYARLTALLIEAIKEQQEQIRELRRQIEASKTEFDRAKIGARTNITPERNFEVSIPPTADERGMP